MGTWLESYLDLVQAIISYFQARPFGIYAAAAGAILLVLSGLSARTHLGRRWRLWFKAICILALAGITLLAIGFYTKDTLYNSLGLVSVAALLTFVHLWLRRVKRGYDYNGHVCWFRAKLLCESAQSLLLTAFGLTVAQLFPGSIIAGASTMMALFPLLVVLCDLYTLPRAIKEWRDWRDKARAQYASYWPQDGAVGTTTVNDGG